MNHGASGPDPIREAILLCVRYSTRSAATTVEIAALATIRNSLAIIFRAIALGISNTNRYGMWRADSANPGYLVRSMDSQEIWVPWNIVGDLPDGDQLARLARLGLSLQTAKDSAVCLSGSATIFGDSRLTGDIDFCEYVNVTFGSFESVVRRSLEVSSPLICIEIKGEQARGTVEQMERLSLPCSEDDLEAFLSVVRSASRGKCDFVWDMGAEGPIEVTKVVLMVDPDEPASEAWNYSFPHQEAVIVNTGGWIPRRLVSPEALGTYVSWLVTQVSGEPLDDQCKVAKRARALARLLFLPAIVHKLDSILATDGLAIRGAMAARTSLYRRLGALAGDPQIESLIDRVFEGICELAGAVPGLRIPTLPGPHRSDRGPFLEALRFELSGLNVNTAASLASALGELRWALDQASQNGDTHDSGDDKGQ